MWGDFMNKKIFIPIIIILLASFALLSFNTVGFKETNTGTAKFVYNDINIETQISDEDLEQIINIFKNKKLCIDSPSCGFSKNVSLKIDNKTFCIANDTCGVIYLLEKDKYFHIDNEENKLLRNILRRYGFIFPCF